MGAHYGPWIEATVPIALGFVVRRGPPGTLQWKFLVSVGSPVAFLLKSLPFCTRVLTSCLA